ncbi:NACHT domain-containing protein [Streptomyces sp. LHD-70]|uniref:NACHT domain-containing protein n=1 Tax=Streptomyces sp. LHD-70 TaxID=3072140 RepID=UPI00280DB746|nr:NACHT domain-containing protein [Streptomyces sp. LHD-70]MDQ8701040.1 NACHT domain-containing protein [Streptomyces sp. LHD-70]
MSRLPQHIRRRRARFLLFGLLSLASLALAWWLLRLDGDESVDQLVGMAGLLTALVALAVSLAQLLPPQPEPRDPESLADDLAATVRAQWQEEVRARQLRDPRVIPLSWAATARAVAEAPEALAGPQVGGRVLRLSLDGRLDGSFDDAAARLAAGYREIPSGRLVVLGEPGAGKTVLAAMLTLGLLARREQRQPVPVLLPVSTWDPVSESFNDWTVRTLATAYYGGQPELPRRLLDERMLLPVLDGLDEMPEPSRRSAVRALNSALGDGLGVVLTCRSAEYQDVIEGGSPVLRRAPVVEVAPVSAEDAIAYLDEVSWPEGVDWQPVYDALRDRPGSPAAVALSAPLALSLARTVYLHRTAGPAELLDLDSPHAVEDHLVDHVVTAAYAAGERGEWRGRAEEAERYLTFLATYLHQHGERDLSWWQMSRRLLSSWAGIIVGLVVGVLGMIGVSLTLPLVDKDDGSPLDLAVLLGVVAAVLTMLTWYAVPDRAPSALSFALRGSLDRLRQGVRTGVTLTGILTMTVLGSSLVVTTLTDSWDTNAAYQYVWTLASAAGIAAAISLAFAVHFWIAASTEVSSGSGPLDLLRRDRTASLVGALIFGVVLGVTAVPLLILGRTGGEVLFAALTGWEHEPPPLDLLARAADGTNVFEEAPLALATTLLPALVCTVLVLVTRAWLRFRLAHAVLAVRGQLPWRLSGFLVEARDRQLLRQSAGAYQFRHVRLQERLANRKLAEDRTPRPRAEVTRRRRTRAALAAVVLLVCFLVVRATLPPDTSHAAMATGDVDAMVFSPPEHHTLLTLRNGTLRSWDTRTGAETWSARLPGVDSMSSDVQLVARRDAALLVGIVRSAGEMGRESFVLPWKGKPRLDSSFQEPVRKLERVTRFGPGDVILGAGGRYMIAGMVVVDGRTGDTRGIPEDWLSTYGWWWGLSDDGTRVVMLDEEGGLSVLDVRKERLVCTAEGVRPWAMNADGTQFATARGGNVRILDARCRATGEQVTVPLAVDTLALDEHGRRLAVTADGITRLYDLPAPGVEAANFR